MTVETGGSKRVTGASRIFWVASILVCAVATVALLIAGRWYGVVTGIMGVIVAVNVLWGPQRAGADPSQTALQRRFGKR
jgi:hypothetical protein